MVLKLETEVLALGMGLPSQPSHLDPLSCPEVGPVFPLSGRLDKPGPVTLGLFLLQVAIISF